MEVKAKSKKIADLKAYLEAERVRLRDEIANSNTTTGEERAGYSSHMAESATAVFEQARNVGYKRDQELLLADVEDALGRIADGSYGTCRRCGGRIDAARRARSGALLRLAVLYPQVGAREAREAFVLTNSETERLKHLRAAPQITPALRTEERQRLLYWFGADTFADSVLATWSFSTAPSDDAEWLNMLDEAKGWKRPEFPVSGKVLLENGIEEGPKLGEILQELEDWWVASGFSASRDELLERLSNRT